MTINHEKKLIFIHMPKSAGTSIVKVLGVENAYMDRTVEEYKEHYKNYWYEYTKFTVIRDPIDRFKSAYKFARMGESFWFSLSGKYKLEKHPHYDLCSSMDINQYVEFLYKDQNKFDRFTIPQSFILRNKDKKFEIDYYVRFENLIDDLKKIGIVNIDKLNSSTIDNEKNLILTSRSKKMLHEIYDVDYKNFNYKKKIFDYE